MRYKVSFDFGNQRCCLTYDDREVAERKARIYDGTDPRPVGDDAAEDGGNE